jgi:DNA primase
MRETKRAVLVEGYFDVLACHRVGVTEAVATCGTALTEEHVRLLKRYVDKVVLCLDTDRAGRDAAERAFMLCSKAGILVEGVTLGQKDPADAAQESQQMLRSMLTESARPYLDIVCSEIRTSDLTSNTVRHAAIERILTLLQSLPTATERSHAVRQAASSLGTTETALMDDLQKFTQRTITSPVTAAPQANMISLYSSTELALGLFLVYPRNIALLQELIPPEEGFPAVLYTALRALEGRTDFTADILDLADEHRHAATILQLYCEENGFGQWNDSVAIREIRRNCKNANRELLHKKQKDITQRLLEARKTGNTAEEGDLTDQYKQLLQLSRTIQ